MAIEKMQINADGMKTRQELVTEALRNAIVQGRFRPGDRLDQSELAEELGVSRSPVREALRTLTAEDLVTHLRHRGTIVTERTVAELHELLHIRKLLEGSAARRAAPQIEDERLAKLKAIIDEANTSDDSQHILKLNHVFHATIYEAYEQPILIEEIQKLRNKIAPYNRLYLDTPGQKQAAWEDHQRIYEACLERDGEKAAHETCEHISRVFQSIIDTQLS